MILTDIKKNAISVGVALQKANASLRKHSVKNSRNATAGNLAESR